MRGMTWPLAIDERERDFRLDYAYEEGIVTISVNPLVGCLN